MDKAVELLGQLAEKLGQTVEALWPHAVRYVVVDGVVGAIGGVVALGLAVYGLKRVGAFIQNEGEKRFIDQSALYPGAIAIAVLCVTIIPVALIGVFSNLPQVFAPEGYLVFKALDGVSQ